MNIIEMAQKTGLEIAVEGNGASRTPTGIYCCDLLSFVMGRAKPGNVWITVISNMNTIAVAVLADVSCVILSEGITLDADSAKKAEEHGICVLYGKESTFEIAKKIDSIISK